MQHTHNLTQSRCTEDGGMVLHSHKKVAAQSVGGCTCIWDSPVASLSKTSPAEGVHSPCQAFGDAACGCSCGCWTMSVSVLLSVSWWLGGVASKSEATPATPTPVSCTALGPADPSQAPSRASTLPPLLPSLPPPPKAVPVRAVLSSGSEAVKKLCNQARGGSHSSAP